MIIVSFRHPKAYSRLSRNHPSTYNGKENKIRTTKHTVENDGGGEEIEGEIAEEE